MAMILLVEDKPRLREVFARELERKGHSVSSVACGTAALSFCQEHSPDAVIIELPLRDGDGLATISALRHRHPSLKIVALSGEYYAHKILLQAHVLGASTTLVIPVAITDLLTAVDDASEDSGNQPPYPTAASLRKRWDPLMVR